MELQRIYDLSRDNKAEELVSEISEFCCHNPFSELKGELLEETNMFRYATKYRTPSEYCTNIFNILLKHSAPVEIGRRAPVEGQRAPQDINTPNSPMQ